jgi:hypothetical protein
MFRQDCYRPSLYVIKVPAAPATLGWDPLTVRLPSAAYEMGQACKDA